MKILLCAINAKYIHTNIAIRQIKKYCEMKNDNNDYKKIEFTINNYIPDILADIYKLNPDIVGFSCYIWNMEMVKKLCSSLKKILPKVKIILGGPEVSYNTEEVLINTKCDYVVSGEGEKVFYNLIQKLSTNLDVSEVLGLTYKEHQGEIKKNKSEYPLELSELSFPYDDFEEIKHKICYYEASRGCPFNCKYCLSSIEKGVRFLPIEKVKKELGVFLEQKVNQVKFVDRTFNCNEGYAIEIIRFLTENDNKITNFHFEVAADLITDKFLSELSYARKGLFQLEIGVQTTNRETLEVISRKSDFSHLSRVVNKILDLKTIHIHLDLIAGLPLENIESFSKSFDDVYNLKPHQLQLGFLKVLKGSQMEKLIQKYLIEYNDFPPYEILSTSVLSYKDVLTLRGVEDMVENFYNTNRFVNSIKYLSGFFNSGYNLFSSMASYKEEYYQSSLVHNKNTAYEFLLNFAKNNAQIDIDIFIWILKYDYLLHEKPKGNPEWTNLCRNLFDKDESYYLSNKTNIIDDVILKNRLNNFEKKEYIKNIHIEKLAINPINYINEEIIVIFDYNQRDIYENSEVFIFQDIDKFNYL